MSRFAEDAQSVWLPCHMLVKWDASGHWAVESEQGDELSAGTIQPGDHDDAAAAARMMALMAAKLLLEQSRIALLGVIMTPMEHTIITDRWVM